MKLSDDIGNYLFSDSIKNSTIDRWVEKAEALEKQTVTDRQLADMVNELRDTAIEYKDCQCLREAISGVVYKYLRKESE